MIDINLYKSGKKIDGYIVKDVVQACDKVVVWHTECNRVQYEYVGVQYDEAPVISKFNNISALIPASLPESVKETLAYELSASLYCALVSDGLDEGLGYFQKIEQKINQIKTPDEAKSLLIITSFKFLMIVTVLLIVLYQTNFLDLNTIYVCMLTGGIGAFCSLLYRNNTINIELTSDTYIEIQGVILTITGVIAGTVTYIFAESNIAFGFVKDNYYGLLAICIAAGFSERLIPDLFGKIKDK